jgi:putative DNA methylase
MAGKALIGYVLPSGQEGRDMARHGRRLIEDYLPIEAVSKEASREKSVRKGHISTLHLWWARRPLVACRAAIYAALIPADAWTPDAQVYPPPADEREAAEERRSLATIRGRGDAGEFIKRLCTYPGDPATIKDAERHILAAHAAKLSGETGTSVTVEDIVNGKAPRPRVLDMFAGGGSIPLEALRLGCEAYALDLNPVAHIIELCTLVYPQKYGKPDKSAKGAAPDGTWAGLAREVEHWGKWVLERVRAELGDLYPPIPNPDYTGNRPELRFDSNTGYWLPVGRNGQQTFEFDAQGGSSPPEGYLEANAYLWCRTVRCKNVNCNARVPLFGQTWLRKKDKNSIALRPQPRGDKSGLDFVLAREERLDAFKFDPSEGMSGTAAVCRCCGATQDAKYVRSGGREQRYGQQLMAVICAHPSGIGKVYLADANLAAKIESLDSVATERLGELEDLFPQHSFDEAIPPSGNAGYATGKSYLHCIQTFRQAYAPKQLLALMSLCKAARNAADRMRMLGCEEDRIKALAACLAMMVGRCVDRCCSLVRWNNMRETIESFSSFKRYAMMWDYPEVNLLASGSGNATDNITWVVDALKSFAEVVQVGLCQRGDAVELPWREPFFDAVITDPPYYDNETYAELSDMFYIWHRLILQPLFPEHTSAGLTPKKKMIVAAAYLHGGTVEQGAAFYEEALAQSLAASNKALKPGGSLILVYAHKTTLGWSTLVHAVRMSNFQIEEAWPLKTEKPGRAAHQEDSALASSIFLVARKRNGAGVGRYEDQVRPNLEEIVRERVGTLWSMNITGADLIIACVGAGLRAYTQYPRVEYANGEEVPAEKFLAEVEGVVLEHLLEKVFSVAGGGVAAVDGTSRFYLLWRYTYKTAELEAGEAIVFTYNLDVELDNGISSGARALVEKKKGKYRLRDFAERGTDKRLGLTDEHGKAAPLIDVLHRALWLLEHEPRGLTPFLLDANPDRERLRLVAHTLAGPGLKGGADDAATPVVSTTPAEQSALGKLLANWNALVEQPLGAGKPTLFNRDRQP